MKLLIVESPAKAKTITKYLDKNFQVISSYGHIRGLPSENGAVDPDHNFAMRYEINNGAQKHVENIISNVKNSDEIYLATDPDREGEAISWHIFEILKERHVLKDSIAVKRVVFHEITKKAVLEAINNARVLNLNLVDAQKARQALDYLVGFTLSPVLWRKLPGSRSAGRVQSVALRMIAERDNEIEKFKIEEYWSIVGLFQNTNKTIFKAHLTHFDNTKLEKFSIRNSEEASRINSHLPYAKYYVESINKKQQKRNPQPPFTTATLIQEASRKLGFSAKKTAQVAQKLYEGINIGGEMVGLITYMRTDSVNISIDSINATRQLIQTNYSDEYLPKEARIYKTKSKNAQEAHEAIRPTDVSKIPQSISSFLETDQLKLYDLIWKRMVASQMESAILDSVSANIKSEDNSICFRATGSSITFPGFYILYTEDEDDKSKDDEDEGLLPKLTALEKIILQESTPLQHFTQPPPRYTEASLVKSMEELGIGRPSTYPTIISILQDRKYVVLEKRRFVTEPLGRLVTAFLTQFFTKYVEYGFTANLEDKLDDIASGQQDWKNVMHEFWHPFKDQTDATLKISNSDILSNIQKYLEHYIFGEQNAQSLEERNCPLCKSGALELKMSKFGSFIGCSNYPQCHYTKKLNAQINHANTSDIDLNASTTNNAKQICHDENGREIILKRGPYGPYLEVIENDTEKAKAKRISIPQGVDVQNITPEYAQTLIALPKTLGNHPTINKPIKVSIGRFGPYVECNKVFASIGKKTGIDFLKITLEEAIKLLEEKEKKGVTKKITPKSTIKKTKTAKKTKKTT